MSFAAIRWARRSRGLTPTQKFVLLILADSADDAGVCWNAAKSIAADTGLTDRTVRYALHDLIDAGAIAGTMRSGIKPRWQLMVAETGTSFRLKRNGLPVSKRKQVPSNRKQFPSKAEPVSDEPSGTTNEPSASAEADGSAVGVAVMKEADPRSALFTTGLRDLAAILDKSEAKARAIVGKLLSTARNDAGAVLEAIRHAKELRPADPMPWLVAAVRSRATRARTIEDEPWFQEIALKEKSTGRWCFNGFYVDESIDMVREAARIPCAESRNWEPLARWLQSGLDLHDDILPAIRRAASRDGYDPPGSLRYFDALLMRGGGPDARDRRGPAPTRRFEFAS